jgi:hypothetical protein
LAYLKNAGLVQDHRQGMRVQYSISRDCGHQTELEGFLRVALPSDPPCREDLRRWAKIKGQPADPPSNEGASAALA